MKRITSFIAALIIVFSLSGCKTGETEQNKEAQAAVEEAERMAEEAEAAYQQSLDNLHDVMSGSGNADAQQMDDTSAEEEPVEENIEYEEVDLNFMFEEMESNPLRAESEFVGKYVVFHGYISSVQAQNGCFFVDSYEASGDGCSVLCNLEKEMRDAITEDSRYELVTVWGRASAYDTIDGKEKRYSVDVKKFEIQEAPNPEEIEYLAVSLSTMKKEYRDNKNDAVEKYLGQYVAFKAKIDKIESDTLTLSEDFSYLVKCKYTSEKQKEYILSKNVGDEVIIGGRVDDIDMSYGYLWLEIKLIEIDDG